MAGPTTSPKYLSNHPPLPPLPFHLSHHMVNIMIQNQDCDHHCSIISDLFSSSRFMLDLLMSQVQMKLCSIPPADLGGMRNGKRSYPTEILKIITQVLSQLLWSARVRQMEVTGAERVGVCWLAWEAVTNTVWVTQLLLQRPFFFQRQFRVHKSAIWAIYWGNQLIWVDWLSWPRRTKISTNQCNMNHYKSIFWPSWRC